MQRLSRYRAHGIYEYVDSYETEEEAIDASLAYYQNVDTWHSDGGIAYFQTDRISISVYSDGSYSAQGRG